MTRLLLHKSGGQPEEPPARVYSLCSFGAGVAAPNVKLIEASSEAEAVELARERLLFTTRELWDGNRLVAVIPPMLSEAS
jgi:hypothetical protein